MRLAQIFVLNDLHWRALIQSLHWGVHPVRLIPIVCFLSCDLHVLAIF